MEILCILDGFGLSDNKTKNAVSNANTKNLDYIFDKYKMVHGNASGLYVGLPEGQMGNSEVGHLNIGAGRIIYQDLTRITKEIQDGVFFKNEELLKAIDHCKINNSSLHLFGLLSDGGVHSHITHLYALLKLAKENNLEKVFVHCFLDGRDTAPNSAKSFLTSLDENIKKINAGKISDIIGRYYAMDRDKNYDRIKLAYDCLTNNKPDKVEKDFITAIQKSYDENVLDEFVLPTAIGTEEDIAKSRIKDNDSIIFFNFRPDRARQITRSFLDDDFSFFNRDKLKNLCFVCFTDYDETIKNKFVAFKKEEITETFGEIISENGFNQIRIAETEKYAHVTFFFNGGIEVPNKNEDRVLVPSPKEVPTYDLKPEMSALKVCDEVIKAIESKKYEVIIVNFANPDMVGHTGVYEAAIKAIETVDNCVGRIYDKIKNTDDVMFICADHGNAEKMIDEDGKPFTAHTSNQVPFCLVNNKKLELKDNGSLCDIIPTLLDVMNIKKPDKMTGSSLVIRKS